MFERRRPYVQHMKNQQERPYFSVLGSLNWLPVRSKTEFKILLLTFKVLNDQICCILKASLHHIIPTELFGLRLQVYLWVRQFPEVEWEADPSAVEPGRKQTPSLLLRVDLKLSAQLKSHNYAAIDLDCWGTSHDALSTTFSRHLFTCHHC